MRMKSNDIDKETQFYIIFQKPSGKVRTEKRRIHLYIYFIYRSCSRATSSQHSATKRNCHAQHITRLLQLRQRSFAIFYYIVWMSEIQLVRVFVSLCFYFLFTFLFAFLLQVLLSYSPSHWKTCMNVHSLFAYEREDKNRPTQVERKKTRANTTKTTST